MFFQLRGLCRDLLSSFFVSHYRKIFLGNHSVLCFRKLPLVEKFLNKRGGEDQDFSIGNLLSHSSETSRSGILWCFSSFGG